MAQELRAVLIDDVDGSEADETFTFEFDGRSYEIDLTTEHAEQLEMAFQLLDPFVDHLRRVGSSPRARRSSTSRGRTQKRAAERGTARGDGAYDPKAIRAWAWENGVELSNRGRIPENIVEKWRATLAS